MLGVRSQACNEFPYIELAKPTLTSMIHSRQFTFYKNCTVENDWPLQRYIIRKALDSKCPFIRHYVKLSDAYTSAEEVTEKSMADIKNTVLQKAQQGKSKYVAYLEMNPTMCKPEMYMKHVAANKMQKTAQLRLISHELEVEVGRRKRPITPREERLCMCGSIEDERHYLFDCVLYYHIRCRYDIDRTWSTSEMLSTNFICDYVYELDKCRKIFKSGKKK